MSSSNDSSGDSSLQSQEGSSGGGEEDRLPLSNYPIIPREELSLGAPLGAGAYGSVYKGTWKVGSKEVPVAIKKVFMLEKEADILSKVRHRNIIQFFGVSLTNPDFFIVTEFAENGSLYDYVHKAYSNDFEFDQILAWAVQIAQGVGYLHYEAPDIIIHRDLKSKNVVLNADLVCKLCDFGTSKNLTHSWTAPSWGGTAAWMSPEIISQKEGITTATDVWSYGVVLWEMISREVPYKGLTEFSIYSMIAQQGVTLVIPEECPFPLADLMKKCWKINPKDRYDMKQVLVALDSMRGNAAFSEECGTFLKHKNEWICEIEKQLRYLEEQKIDYAKRIEELSKRERALKRREESQRELMEADAFALDDDVALWDESQVCQWIRKISAALPLTAEMLDRLVALIIHHNISGRRLLDITPKDLEYLGVCSLGLRTRLFREIQHLCKENHKMKNFPTLEVSQQQLDQQKRNEKAFQPLCFSLVIHVTMYTRQSGFDLLPKFRYKIVVDTDWENAYLSDDLPEDLRNAHSVVKDVCISLIYDDKVPLYEPFRCTRGPFAVADWIDSPMSGGEVGIVCAISYSDRVIRPRNTCVRTKLFDFSRPQTLESKKVDLVIRSTCIASPNKTPLPAERHQYKASSSVDSGVGLSSGLQGAWRSRVANGLAANEISDAFSSTSTPPSQNCLQKSPLWADIAAGLRGDISPLPVPSPSVISERDGVPFNTENLPLSCEMPIDIVPTPSVSDTHRLFSPGFDQICHSESLFRDSVLVTRPHKDMSEHIGKTFRHHLRQQTSAVNRKANTYRIRRRPLPIILPPRRKVTSISLARENSTAVVPEINVVDSAIVVPDASPFPFEPAVAVSLPEAFNNLRLQPVDITVTGGTDDLKESVKGSIANGTESVKKRRRRRHRPHRRGNPSDQDRIEAEDFTENQSGDQNNGLKDAVAKQNREYVHGGCNKWSWKAYGREPE